MRPQPPRLARLLLSLRRLGLRRDDIHADLAELFDMRASEQGLRAARRAYWRDVASLWWRPRPRQLASSSVQSSGRTWALQSLWQDAVFACRMFRRQPGPYGTTVAGIALAIGITTALFAAFHAVALRGDGVREPEGLYQVQRSKGAGSHQGWSFSELQLLSASPSIAFAAQGDAIGDLSGDAGTQARRDRPTARASQGTVVNGAFFETLGARPALGRLLQQADDVEAAPPAVVLAYGYWKSRFAGDAQIVGRTAWFRGHPVTVVGVAERGFSGPGHRITQAFWLTISSYRALTLEDREANVTNLRRQLAALAKDTSPVGAARRNAIERDIEGLSRRWDATLSLHGRLRDVVPAERIGAELTALARAPRLARGDLKGAESIVVRLTSFEVNAAGGGTRTIGSVIVGALLLVIVVASANIANVLTASAIGRQHEIGTRLALGASRGRIVRQLLTESVILGAIGGAAGLLASLWLTPALGRLLRLPDATDLTPHPQVYLFATMGTLVASLAAGVLPALHGRRGNLASALKTTSGSGGAQHQQARRGRHWLVVMQTAASVLLLILAALITRTLTHLTTVDLGYNPERLLAIRTGFSSDPVGDAVLERVRSIPGVSQAAFSMLMPMSGGSAAIGSAPGEDEPDQVGRSLRRVHTNMTTADYFDTLGLRLVRGRVFTADEVRTGAPVAVISQSLARVGWGNDNPIGSSLERIWGKDDAPGAPRLGFLTKPASTKVIGIVTDTIQRFQASQTSAIYLPLDAGYGPFGNLIVNADNPGQVAPAVEQAIRSVDPDFSGTVRFTLNDRDESMQMPRAIATIGSIFGLSALGIAMIGLYGVTTSVVAARRREVSVRLALGATPETILRMLLVDSLRPVVIGTAAGLLIAFVGAQALRRLPFSPLYGVSPEDPIALSGALMLLLASALVAVLVPTRRATRVDPALALKSE